MFTLDEKVESFVASGDLTALRGRVAAPITGANFKIGVAGAGEGIGVFLDGVANGDHAPVVVGGITMVYVGAAVQAGNLLTSAASGWAVAVNTEAVDTFGTALANTASGMLAPVRVERQPFAG